MEPIQYKFEVFEGPLELLLTLVEKNKLQIEDIPIDLLCEQYLAYISEAALRSVELACEFLDMASELMLIKSRMLLPRNPEKDDDPRKPLIDAILEYRKAKLAATELSDLFSEYGSRMIKEQDDVSPDRTYVADHSVELLKAALVHVYSETPRTGKNVQDEFSRIVNAPRIPVEELMTRLIDDLREDSLFLDDYFRKTPDRPSLIAKFLGILELLKSHIVSLEEVAADESGITDIRCHAKLSLIASEEEIRSAALDTYA